MKPIIIHFHDRVTLFAHTQQTGHFSGSVLGSDTCYLDWVSKCRHIFCCTTAHLPSPKTGLPQDKE
jgi:hypothetical protein